MRVLQSTYCLEPAGSHGVWELDNYHFLSVLFGSSQLRGEMSCHWQFSDDGSTHEILGHKHIRPKAIHDPEIVDEHSQHCMYFACIGFINSVSINKWSFIRLTYRTADQNCIATVALSHAGWHSCGTTIHRPDPKLSVICLFKVDSGMIKMFIKLKFLGNFQWSILPHEGPEMPEY